MAGMLIYSWWIFSVERSKPKEFAWPINIPHWMMVLNAILSFILKQYQDTEKIWNFAIYAYAYWLDFLQYACERIAKSWPALSMSPPINIPSEARSDWPQNISRPLGCNVESIFHVDQISIHNNTVYIWLFMKASQNVREPFNQGVNPPPH